MCNYTLMKMFENIIQCILQLVVIWRPLSYTKATKLQRSDLDLLIYNVFFFLIKLGDWNVKFSDDTKLQRMKRIVIVNVYMK